MAGTIASTQAQVGGLDDVGADFRYPLNVGTTPPGLADAGLAGAPADGIVVLDPGVDGVPVCHWRFGPAGAAAGTNDMAIAKAIGNR